MRLNGFDLNLLVVFEALLDEQSVSKAAARLNVVQSAVSSSLSRLREQFKDDLFTLTGNRMVPTPFALDLQNDVRNIIQQSKSLVSVRVSFDPRTSQRRFTLAGRIGMGFDFLQLLYRRIRQEAPFVEVSLRILSPARPVPPQEAASILTQGGLDILFVAKEDASPRLPIDQGFDVHWCCIASRENRLLKDRLTMKDFLTLEHVCIEFCADEPEPFINTYLRERELNIKVGPIVGDHTIVPEQVAHSNWIALVPIALANYAMRYYPLRVFPTPFEAPTVPVVMQWNPATARDPAMEWFRGCIRDILPDVRRLATELYLCDLPKWLSQERRQ